MPSGLWQRNFVLYFVARAVALVGDAMIPVAVTLAVREVGYGNTGVGIVLAAWMTPFGLLVLFGGVFADRFTARRMMVGADVIRIGTQLVVAIALFTHAAPLWLLIAMSAVAGAAAAMFQPGLASMVPQVASDLQRANAALRVAGAVAELLGPALAATLTALFGPGTVYTVNAATFAVSAGCLLALRLPPIPLVAKVVSLRADLRTGWHEFRTRTWMWSVILVWALFGVLLFGPLIPLGSGVVTSQFGAYAYGIALSANGAGTVVGGLLALRFSPTRPLATGALAMTLYGLIPLSIAVHAGIPLLLLAHFVGGVAWAFWSVMWATSVQTHIPSDVLNRVSAFEVAGSVVSIPIGQVLAGPLAALAGAEHVLAFSAVVGVIGCVALVAVVPVRELGRQPLRVGPAETPARTD